MLSQPPSSRCSPCTPSHHRKSTRNPLLLYSDASATELAPPLASCGSHKADVEALDTIRMELVARLTSCKSRCVMFVAAPETPDQTQRHGSPWSQWCSKKPHLRGDQGVLDEAFYLVFTSLSYRHLE